MTSPIKYTTNRAIDHFNVGATLMKIIGYVDCIEGLRELPKSPSKWIYKCILNNNNGRRVRILCWGDDALKYNDEIKMYQIIKITGGIIKAANPQYRRSTDTVGDKEFQFGRGSTFDILGTFNITNGADNGKSKVISYEKIEMENVCAARGPVQITGWLKEPFRTITTVSGSSYGCGMFCTRVHRMTIHVVTYIPREDLIEGIKMTIKGRVDRRGDGFVLNINSMDDIAVLTEDVALNEDELDDAVEAPPLTLKRGAVESASGEAMDVANKKLKAE